MPAAVPVLAVPMGPGMSDPQAAWIEAFLTAQSKLPKIVKDTAVSAGSYGYKYANLPDILEQVNPVLRGEGLVLFQSVVGDGAAVGVETRIAHKAGHVEVFGPVLLRVAGDAKAAGSAITYARRYALTAALGIAPDEDDDGAAASTPAKQPAELSPWQWFLNESKVLKGWTEDQVLASAKEAFAQYAYTSKTLTRAEAATVLEYVRNAYETEGRLV